MFGVFVDVNLLPLTFTHRPVVAEVAIRVIREVILVLELGFAVVVELLDCQLLFFQLHSTVLKPDLDLPLRQTQRMRNLYASFPGQIVVELKLFLQLQGLIAAVRLSATASLGGIRTCGWKDVDMFISGT